jgi:AbrB family looped-hinge helix DNA binding protein
VDNPAIQYVVEEVPTSGIGSLPPLDSSLLWSYSWVRKEGKMAVTSLSVKGQVVIPKALREALGLKPGDKLLVVREGDTIVLKPLRGKTAATLYGRYKGVDLLSDLKEEHLQEIQGESRQRSL